MRTVAAAARLHFPLVRFALLVTVSIVSSQARAAEPATIATQGNTAVPACASCHGKAGEGQGTFPRLAGMNADYLRKQFEDFAAGRRENAVMKPIASALSPGDRKAMADYYARLPIASGLARPAQPSGMDDSVGARLAMRGAWSKGVPACVQCHGPGGVGVGTAFPALAGQPSAYIAAQLQAWRTGTRRNDPLELMRHLAMQLDEKEIEAVSDWFARQPVAVTGARP